MFLQLNEIYLDSYCAMSLLLCRVSLQFFHGGCDTGLQIVIALYSFITTKLCTVPILWEWETSLSAYFLRILKLGKEETTHNSWLHISTFKKKNNLEWSSLPGKCNNRRDWHCWTIWKDQYHWFHEITYHCVLFY